MTCEQLVWLNCRWQSSKILSDTLLRCNLKEHNVLNAENSQKLIFRLFTDKLERSWWRLSNRHSADDVEQLRLPQSPTFVAVVVELTTAWPHTAGPDVTLLFNYTTLSPTDHWLHGYDNVPSSPTCRWLRGSVNPSSSTPGRWSPGFDNVPPSATPQSAVTRRSVHYDDKLVPAPQASEAAWLRCIFLVAC